MEERVDEARGEDHEAGHVLLHGGVDVVILVRGDFEVLFELDDTRACRRASPSASAWQ